MGHYVEQLHPDPPPAELRYLWNWYTEVDSGRGFNGFGPNPISWPDMHAWAALTGTAIEPWEVRVIKQLDDLHLRAMTEKDG